MAGKKVMPVVARKAGAFLVGHEGVTMKNTLLLSSGPARLFPVALEILPP
jgi:hypothetical protein